MGTVDSIRDVRQHAIMGHFFNVSAPWPWARAKITFFYNVCISLVSVVTC